MRLRRVHMQAQIADFVRAQVAQATKAKRARSDGSVTQQIESKVHRPDLDTGDFALSDDELTRCSLRAMKGKVYGDLRKFYRVCSDGLPSGGCCSRAAGDAVLTLAIM